MRPVSAAFLRAIRGSHTMVARARVVTAGLSGTTPVGTYIPIIAGDVQLDATANIRSTIDLTTDGTGMWPTTASSPLLTVTGNELFVERGVQYGSGITEWVSLGYHRIDDVDQEEAPDGQIRITGSDRMAGLIDGRLIQPRQFAAGTTLGTVVSSLVTEVYPGATITWDDATSANTLSTSQVTEDDRWGFLNDLITAQGKIWYWDYRGILVIKDPPSSTMPVWTVDFGTSGVLVKMSRSLTRSGVYNAVVATGETADSTPAVWAIAYDANPASPTYFGSGVSGGVVLGAGPFGPVPEFYSSPLLTTSAQALKAAQNMLTSQLGLPYSLDLTAVPNVALEPWDPITVTYPKRARSYASTSETHILQTLSIPLTYGEAMTGTTRQQTLVSVGSLTS